MRIYKSNSRSKLGGIDLEIDAQELDLEETIEDERHEEISNVEDDIFRRGVPQRKVTWLLEASERRRTSCWAPIPRRRSLW